MERTLAIVKPDAVANGVTGKILTRIQKEGFRVVAMRQMHLTRAQAEGFYAVHRERPFFGELTAFMSSGPCVPLVLERATQAGTSTARNPSSPSANSKPVTARPEASLPRRRLRTDEAAALR